MIDQIKKIADWDSKTPEQLHAELSTLVLKPDSFYTFNTLALAISGGLTTAETLVAAMRAAHLNASADSLISRGIDFSLPPVQQMIDQLASIAGDQFTAELAAELKALGQCTAWESFGGTGDVPELTEISDWKDEQAREAIRVTAVRGLQSKANAVGAWLGTEAARAMSPTDYQAYAEMLLATEDGNSPPEGT